MGKTKCFFFWQANRFSKCPTKWWLIDVFQLLRNQSATSSLSSKQWVRWFRSWTKTSCRALTHSFSHQLIVFFFFLVLCLQLRIIINALSEYIVFHLTHAFLYASCTYNLYQWFFHHSNNISLLARFEKLSCEHKQHDSRFLRLLVVRRFSFEKCCEKYAIFYEPTKKSRRNDVIQQKIDDSNTGIESFIHSFMSFSFSFFSRVLFDDAVFVVDTVSILIDAHFAENNYNKFDNLSVILITIMTIIDGNYSIQIKITNERML